MTQNHFRAVGTDDATLERIMDAHTDVTGAAHVQVRASRDNTVLWVNVNGILLLRVCRIRELELPS